MGENSYSCVELFGGLFYEVAGSSLHNGLNLHFVAWVGDHNGKFLLHAPLSELEGAMYIGPELSLWISSSFQVDSMLVHANGCHHSVGSEEAFILLKSWSESCLGIDVTSNGHL